MGAHVCMCVFAYICVQMCGCIRMSICVHLCGSTCVCMYIVQVYVCVKDLKWALVITTIVNSVGGVSVQTVADLERHSGASSLRQRERLTLEVGQCHVLNWA